MANQYTVSTLTGIPISSYGHFPSAGLQSLWEQRSRIKVTTTGCWEWLGSKTKDGYGTIGSKRKSLLIHRVAYEICVGPAPKGMEVCHNCPGGDNPSCCNPHHLFLATHDTNMKDAARKGRIKPRDSKGEKNPSAKLTSVKIQQIRDRAKELCNKRGISTVIATEFGVSPATIRRILNGKIWSHIK